MFVGLPHGNFAFFWQAHAVFAGAPEKGHVLPPTQTLKGKGQPTRYEAHGENAELLMKVTISYRHAAALNASR